MAKPNNPIRKMDKRYEKTFGKEDVWIATKHMKGCSMSLAIQGKWIKGAVEYPYIQSGCLR